ncbi:hypothetical protein GcC1_193028 [Golovinomyces cichoracearum]|uniref:Uncharacterized protein n=1 Tax=Golovinomyces cichoracearum TaxID=62708 RepID=A0A420HHH2_9PEZI|nr:hypothetical protein GcC1_193028 [Golovinomyces cichoracearum]
MRDPELPTLSRAPNLSQRPAVTETVTEDQVEQKYTIMLTEHRFRHAAYVDEKARVIKILDKYDALNGWVRQYVHPENYGCMRKEKTLFRQLLASKRQFAPTDRAKELRVTQL